MRARATRLELGGKRNIGAPHVVIAWVSTQAQEPSHTRSRHTHICAAGAPRTHRFSVHVVFDNDGDGDVDVHDMHHLEAGHASYTKKALFKEVRGAVPWPSTSRHAHTPFAEANPYSRHH